MSEKFSTYKGFPLVRCGDEIYYGYMSDPYKIWTRILDAKEEDGEKFTTNVRITLVDNNEADLFKSFVKTAERECGLYEALDFADVWLRKALAEK